MKRSIDPFQFVSSIQRAAVVTEGFGNESGKKLEESGFAFSTLRVNRHKHREYRRVLNHSYLIDASRSLVVAVAVEGYEVSTK